MESFKSTSMNSSAWRSSKMWNSN